MAVFARRPRKSGRNNEVKVKNHRSLNVFNCRGGREAGFLQLNIIRDHFVRHCLLLVGDKKYRNFTACRQFLSFQ